MARKMVDCREFPSQSKCTLTIAGEEDEVVRAATLHAVDVHGHKDTAEFRDEIRRSLKDERVASR
jgi:predicted small metal-binding protein